MVILFGGRSAEHEVSILSARNVYLALDKERFEPVLIGIDKHGGWHHADTAALLEAVGDPRQLTLHADAAELVVPVRPTTAADVLPVLSSEDVVFPVLHGTYGEDGTMQGLLELADVAYVGPGHLGSAIGMDKEVAKRLLDHAGIPVVPWVTVRAAAHRANPDQTVNNAEKLGYPLFVKPANAGSSVGVSKVASAGHLLAAVDEALRFDTKVLLEAAVDAREVEVAVLGNDAPIAAEPGEVIVHHRDGFYSYDAKYVDAAGSEVRIPAELPPERRDALRALAIDVFQCLELAGLARVDFFVERTTGALYVNEVNTLPGFTAVSMYPQMWAASGLPPQALVTRLVELAIERRAARRALSTNVGG